MKGGQWSVSNIPSCQGKSYIFNTKLQPKPQKLLLREEGIPTVGAAFYVLQAQCRIYCGFLTITETIYLTERYCGPVPQIDNGFAVASTNVTYRGQATYQCYAGFGFSSGLPTETIRCTDDGKWGRLPICLASSCSPLPEAPHSSMAVLNGGGRSYGTVVRFECNEGYFRTGIPVIVCMSDGQWSAPPPRCERKCNLSLF